MLNLYPQYVARNYMLFVTLAALGTIQAAASVAGLRGLQIGGRLWPPRLAYTMMGICWVGGAILFVGLTPDYISPGLAGSELIAMFALGTIVALAASLAGGSLCRGLGQWRAVAGEQELPGGCTCRLTLPSEPPAGLVVLIADPDLPPSAAEPAAAAAVRAGFACARLAWSSPRPAYPDALALLPSAIAQLGDDTPWVRPLVVAGLGLGADLALRAAHDDSRVTLACAVGPALAPGGILDGVLLLREMSIASAWRWRGRWDRRGWLRGLRSAEAVQQAGGRVAILVSDADGLTEAPAADALAAQAQIAHASHHELVTVAAPALLTEQLQSLREDAIAGA